MKPVTLLAVDDEKFVLSSLKRLFREPKYTLYTASTTDEALEILEQHEIGVILCDYKMEPLRGTDFLEITRKKWPDISRILLTGYFNSQIAQSSLQKGAVYRFITKPWNDDDLKVTVENSWRRYQLVRQNRELLKLIRSQNDHLKHLTSNLKHVIENRIEKTVKSKDAVKAKKIQLQITHSLIKGLGQSKSLKEIFKTVLTELQKLIPFDDASVVVELSPDKFTLLHQNNISSEEKVLTP